MGRNRRRRGYYEDRAGRREGRAYMPETPPFLKPSPEHVNGEKEKERHSSFGLERIQDADRQGIEGKKGKRPSPR